MGGLGSGRPARHLLTSEVAQLDSRWMQRHGLLAAGGRRRWQWGGGEVPAVEILVQVSEPGLWVTYRSMTGTDEVQAVRYAIAVAWTPCHFGGRRPWLLCPVATCQRRVAVLYGGPVFACRHCLDLVYPSQREGRVERSLRQAHALTRRLGGETRDWQAGISKPRGMHWRTYRRLEAARAGHVGKALAGLVEGGVTAGRGVTADSR